MRQCVCELLLGLEVRWCGDRGAEYTVIDDGLRRVVQRVHQSHHVRLSENQINLLGAVDV